MELFRLGWRWGGVGGCEIGRILGQDPRKMLNLSDIKIVKITSLCLYSRSKSSTLMFTKQQNC